MRVIGVGFGRTGTDSLPSRSGDASAAAAARSAGSSFRVQCGWAPLREFLDVEAPEEPFPHVNSRGEVQRLAAREVARSPVELFSRRGPSRGRDAGPR